MPAGSAAARAAALACPRTFHAWARLEARLLNWEGLRLLNEQAQQAFPPSRGGAVGGVQCTLPYANTLTLGCSQRRLTIKQSKLGWIPFLPTLPGT